VKISTDDPTYGSQLGGTTGVIAGGAAAAEVAEHVADTDAAHLAQAVTIVDASSVRHWPLLALSSGIATSGNYFGSDNVEGALAEIGAALQTLAGGTVRHWPMLALSSGATGGLGGHLADTSDAHDASAISIADAGGLYAATDVEGALAEILTNPSRVWMPLTTVSPSSIPRRYWPMLALSSEALAGGTPELVWEADGSLIPTLVPI
jgi:hypothetical protein